MIRSASVAQAWRTPTSAHRSDVLRLDPVEHAHFVGAPLRVHRLAGVLLRELVGVLIGTVLGDLDDAAANLEIAVRVVRVLDGN